MFRTCLQFNFIFFVLILTIVLTLFTGLCCLRHGDQHCQACSEASACKGTTGLVSVQEGIQRSFTAWSSTCAAERFLHIILETLHCWLTFIGQSWQKWKRNHGVVDGAGDSASRATTDVRIVAPIGRIETPPMSIKHVEPVHDDGSSNGAMEI